MKQSSSIAITDSSGRYLVREDTVLPIYSLTKPFIASAILAAGIDIESPISAWIEQSLVPRGHDISVKQLLSHTSGIMDYGGLPEYVNAVSSGQRPWTDEVFADHTLRQPLLFEPGESWAYSNPGYWLLSQIIQMESGQDLNGAFRHYLFDPLELSDIYVANGQFAPDLSDYEAGWVWHGLLMSSASNVVTFMRSDFVKPLLDDLYAVPFQVEHWHSPHYGYGLMTEPGVRFGHNGEGPNYSASCFHFRHEDLTGCVIMRADHENAAMNKLVELINDCSK
jgi:D-alanyl-D-alanine carboxypeptidase